MSHCLHLKAPRIIFLVLIFVLCSVQTIYAIPAFPGAEGFGAAASGGRGGAVYFVTNLNNSGSGSFTECVKQSNTTCIFKVGGAIDYGTNELVISGNNLTIAGQTAPGGITIKGALVDGSGSALINLQGENIIIRHIAIRGGGDPLRLEGAKNVILDHISLSWATDENFGGTSGSENITVQWSLIGEGIIGHSKAIILTTGANKFSFHHNLFAHNEERHPRLQTGQVEFINNVIFNHLAGSIIETRPPRPAVPIQLNYIGNWMVAGPAIPAPQPGDSPAPWYNKNLDIKEGETYYADNNHDYKTANDALLTSTKHAFSMNYPVTVDAGNTILQKILQKAGAFHFSRDPVDTRIVNETSQGIKNPAYSSSYPTIGEVRWPNYSARNSSVQDADNDGMDDAWEQSKGLNPSLADGSTLSTNGYSNLELYLNELAQGEVGSGYPPETPSPSPSPTISPTPTTQILESDIAPLNAPNGKVDIFDYNLLLGVFGSTGERGFHPADIVKNGTVDIFDYNKLLSEFGR
jgi:pectate lyase